MVRRIRKVAVRMAGANSLLVVVALTPAVANAGVLLCFACAACLVSPVPSVCRSASGARFRLSEDADERTFPGCL